ncbi:enediyne biosynthesis protein UnbU [Mesorhizobium silamurunense]|uniref:enediyne biosynthesis protein UnbU n=1 Tax=Mesorhizobium silamurunense TaxID=499528 RepID=UPI001783E9EA|nr:enediyne biosynthesis protein UnbU [Mesorhizobium silamurunense]
MSTATTPLTGRRVDRFEAVAERWYSEKRLGGLSRFAFAITVLNIVGHAFLGFEQSWITPFVAVGITYSVDLIGETLEARAAGRKPRYAGEFLDLVRFLLPAHISGLAVGMLLYSADNLAAVAFAASVAVGSKYVFRVAQGQDKDGKPVSRHFLNPSNFGITVTLLLFPAVGIAPPYQFSENTWGFVDWLLPLVIVGTGSYLNRKATGRIPLILTWVTAFAAQAIIRAAINGTPITSGLVPMTGFAFILFTFYMITDPATTPARTRGQIAFAVAVALAYAVFMELHVVFGLFFALTVVTAGRGALLAIANAGLRVRSAGQNRRSAALSPGE